MGNARPSPARRFSVLFQWFLIALSVRPGRCRAIAAQALPYCACAASSASSSSAVQSPRLMLGSRWLCHLQKAHFLHLCGTEDETDVAKQKTMRCAARPVYSRVVDRLMTHQPARHCLTAAVGQNISPLAALLADAAWQLLGDKRPALRAEPGDQLHDQLVLLRSIQLPLCWDFHVADGNGAHATYKTNSCRPGFASTNRTLHVSCSLWQNWGQSAPQASRGP